MMLSPLMFYGYRPFFHNEMGIISPLHYIHIILSYSFIYLQFFSSFICFVPVSYLLQNS